ncbi:MAG: Tim44 domain-containing protein [Ruminiclostridium sp.]|nr:Tim44 domain-containing protein [Ruminiclostridium sp.]
MKKKPGVFAAVLIAAVLLICTGASAFDANDYDYGGGGGYSYDYGGGGDYSYDYGGSSWDDDDDYHSSSGSSSGEYTWQDMLTTVIILVVVIGGGGIWASIPSKSKGGKTPATPRSPKNVQVPNRTTEIRNAALQFDPSFSSEQMMTFAQNTFIAVQNAWCAKDLEPVRGLMHNNLFNTTSRQVQAKIDQHVTYHYENYTFRNVYLTSYVRDSDYEYMTVYLNTEYIDYQTDDNTGAVIKGDKTTMWKMRYLMKFMRSTARPASGQGTCPNCGAPLEIASTGKCVYCGSTVTTSSFDWLLCDFTTVRADTKDDGIRI